MVHVFVPDHSVQCKYRYVGVKKKKKYINLNRILCLVMYISCMFSVNTVYSKLFPHASFLNFY